MSKAPPTYYPPRARWYTRLFAWYRLRQKIGQLQSPVLDRLMSSRPLDWIIPGYVFYSTGNRLIGVLMFLISLAALALYIWSLGVQPAYWALAVILMMHTGSAFYAVKRRKGALPIGEAVAIWFMYAAMYTLTVCVVMQTVIADYEVDGQRMLIDLRSMTYGDSVLFYPTRIHRAPQGIMIEGGMSFGVLVAQPGDRVVFGNDHYELNGVSHRALEHMPTSGEIVLEPNIYLIWPKMKVQREGRVPQDRIAATFLQLAQVPREQCYGRKVTRWFGRTLK